MKIAQEATLQAKADVLRSQLKLDAALPIAEVIEQAATSLGLESEMEGLKLVEKASKCLSQVLPKATVTPMVSTAPTAIAQPISQPTLAQQPSVMQREGRPIAFRGKPTESHAGLYLHIGLCLLVPNCVTAVDDRTLRMRGCFLGWPLRETYKTVDGIRYNTDSDSCGNADSIEKMGPCFTFESCILGPGCRVKKFEPVQSAV